jgi:hypothetical protein
VEDFTKCIQLYPPGTPTVVSSHFHLAKAFTKLGQNVKAVEHLNQVFDMQSQIGGLSTTELAEAQTLLKQLQEGN